MFSKLGGIKNLPFYLYIIIIIITFNKTKTKKHATYYNTSHLQRIY